MPRANRYFLPGHVWHITHRCHQRKFLLKFAGDRRRYLHWLFEAKKRFGLCVIDYYIVTSNDIHLLVKDTGQNVIAQSMQLIAGRTAQEYNQRKGKQGAFWEDCYHATVVQADEHLHRCMVYIDLNMVRAGVVNHPEKWEESGFCEIQKPPKRYAIIDLQSLSELSGFADLKDFQRTHLRWIEQGLENGLVVRDDSWSEAIAVGSRSFVEKVKSELEFKAAHREVIEAHGSSHFANRPKLTESNLPLKVRALRSQNTFLWDETVDETRL